MYCVPVKAGDRGRLSEDEIASQLLFILSDAPCLPTKPAPVGLLTAEPRSIWARDRLVLLLNEQNQRNIELIEQALVLVCLDESLPTSFNARGFNGATESTNFCGARVSFSWRLVWLTLIEETHYSFHQGWNEYGTWNDPWWWHLMQQR